jgi:hypothetical protein
MAESISSIIKDCFRTRSLPRYKNTDAIRIGHFEFLCSDAYVLVVIVHPDDYEYLEVFSSEIGRVNGAWDAALDDAIAQMEAATKEAATRRLKKFEDLYR